jgi:hypothetical protein
MLGLKVNYQTKSITRHQLSQKGIQNRMELNLLQNKKEIIGVHYGTVIMEQ